MIKIQQAKQKIAEPRFPRGGRWDGLMDANRSYRSGWERSLNTPKFHMFHSFLKERKWSELDLCL